MKYCSECGGEVALAVPPEDDRPRHVCSACGAIHYHNPRIITGCIAEWEGRILLCRRAIDPGQGRWTMPAGYMENGESTEHAAVRETREETGAEVALDTLFSVFSIPRRDQVYLVFRGRMLSARIEPGRESLEARLFRAEEIPWDDLTFPVIRVILGRYIDERTRGQFGLYIGGLDRGEVFVMGERRAFP